VDSDATDRIGAGFLLASQLLSAVNTAWNAAAAASRESPSSAEADGNGDGGTSPLVITPLPAPSDLVLSAEADEEEDDENDDESGDDEGSASASGVDVVAIRSRALDAANMFSSIATTLEASISTATAASTSATTATPQHVKSNPSLELARFASAFSALLQHVSLHLLTESSPAEAATALSDIIVCSRTLLMPAAAVADAFAPQPDTASTTTASGSSRKSKKRRSSSVGLVEFQSKLRELSASVSPATDDDEEGEADAAAEPGTAAEDKDLLVFTDAAIALMTNASASLRDALKAACRYAFSQRLTADVIISLARVATKGAADTEADDESIVGGSSDAAMQLLAEDDDAESITLDASDGLAALLGKEDGAAAPAPENGKPKTKTAAAGSKRKRVAQARSDLDDESGSGSDKDDEDEEEEEDEGDETGEAEAEMARYDGLLADMLRQRRTARVAARLARTHAVHFRFRVLDLLEVAAARLAARDAALAPASGAVLVAALPACLRALHTLAARAKARGGGGSGAASGSTSSGAGAGGGANGAAANTSRDAVALFNRLHTLVLRMAKTRVALPLPTPGQAPQAAATAVLDALDAVLATAANAPSPAFVEACAAVASMLLRMLRAPTAAAGGPGSGGSSGGQPQVAPQYLDRVSAAYGGAMVSYLSEKHSRMSPALFNAALTAQPALGVRLLPSVAAALASGAISKPFRVVEAVEALNSIVTTARAPWAAALPCAIASAGGHAAGAEADGAKASKKSKQKAKRSTPLETLVITTISEYLRHAMPSVNGALAYVLSASSASEQRLLNSKQLKTPLTLLRLLLKPPTLCDKLIFQSSVDAATAFKDLEGGVGQLASACIESFEA
jgi:hypothetical protein